MLFRRIGLLTFLLLEACKPSQFATWAYHAGEPMIEAIVDLTSLVCQRVELTLALRPQSDRKDAWAVWVDPQIVKTKP